MEYQVFYFMIQFLIVFIFQLEKEKRVVYDYVSDDDIIYFYNER